MVVRGVVRFLNNNGKAETNNPPFLFFSSRKRHIFIIISFRSAGGRVVRVVRVVLREVPPFRVAGSGVWGCRVERKMRRPRLI